MNEALSHLPEYLAAHVRLTVAALAIGIVVSVPLGVAARRVPWLERVVLGVAGVVQTIPGLALLAGLVPLLAALGLPGIGPLPALLGLSLYSLLPILRNTVTGLAGVDASLLEAARGIGMTPWQSLRRVELPLALPVIVAGIRTATVWTVGTATLSTPVGATSLGNFIFSGLQTRNQASVLVGCAAAAALAIALDGLVRVLERGVVRRSRLLVGGVLAAVALVFGLSVGKSVVDCFSSRPKPVVIGAKTFTEQYVLAELLAAKTVSAGSEAEVLSSLGSSVAFDALVAGDIDVYVDYSGTIWTNVLGHTTVPAQRADVLAGVERELAERHDVIVIARLGFENTYALAARGDVASRHRLRRVSDLVPHAKNLVIGGDYEFFQRPEWRAVRGAYGFAFREERSMDPSLMYTAAASGEVDVISAFSTDGRIDVEGLIVLEDDRGAIPPYDAIVLGNGAFVRSHAEVVEAMRSLEGRIDAASMRRLNAAVDADGEAPGFVARGFLSDAD